MATDKTEPKVGLIVKIGVLAIVSVVGVRIGLVSYFRASLAEERQRKYEMQQPDILQKVRDDEAKAMGNVEASMKAMAGGQRAAGIEPKQSNDMAPMEGWRLMPRPVPAAPAEVPDAGAPATAAVEDAGAADSGATDAAASDAAKGDAAPKEAPKPQEAPKAPEHPNHP